MPFQEIILPQTKRIIKIRNNNKIFISSFLRKKHFANKRVRVFHDPELKLIGLKPDEDGYKIDQNSSFSCRELIRIIKMEKTIIPNWNKQEQMLIFSYK